jgi:hypothetical protein
MLVDGELIRDGKDMVLYLDRRLGEIRAQGKLATGIVIGTRARKELSRACQTIMGQPPKDEEIINRYRNVLLIEDGENVDRIEIIFGKSPILPVEELKGLNLRRAL